MVLGDAEGLPILNSCCFLADCESPLEAELQACMEGLNLALHNSVLPIIVETDCSQLIAAVKSSGQDRSPFLHLVFQIKLLARSECVFVKVERSQVRVSHGLANLASLESRTATW
jgi:hypothetical protein